MTDYQRIKRPAYEQPVDLVMTATRMTDDPRITAALALHTPFTEHRSGRTFCRVCVDRRDYHQLWPCDTRRALEGDQHD